jgi:hypothetical protein
MKDMKRAYRRHKKQVKFLNRLRNQVNPQEHWGGYYHKHNKEDIIKDSLEGIGCYQKLRTMSTRCSCSMCAYYKYERKEFKNDTRRILMELQKY